MKRTRIQLISWPGADEVSLQVYEEENLGIKGKKKSKLALDRNLGIEATLLTLRKTLESSVKKESS